MPRLSVMVPHRAASAGAHHAQSHDSVLDVQKLDIPAVHRDRGTDRVERGLDLLAQGFGIADLRPAWASVAPGFSSSVVSILSSVMSASPFVALDSVKA